jgi:hypothetical protein
LRRKHADLIASIFDQLLGLGATVSVNGNSDLLQINAEYTASLIIARCRETRAGSHRRQLRFDESLSPDVVIAARLWPANEEILDYYLLPRLDVLTERLSLRSENGLILDVYRFNNRTFLWRWHNVHMRFAILKSIGIKEAKCLLSTDDEAYPITGTLITYPRSRSTSCCLRL